jgi:hypothetical protein
MKRVVGFEGSWPTSALIAWGAAAVEDDVALTNTSTGHSTSPLSKADLVTSGALTLLPDAIELRPEHESLALIVLALRKDNDQFQLLVPDTGRLGGVAGTKRSKTVNFYVFRDRTAFAQYASDIAERVTSSVLRSPRSDESTRALISSALILMPSSPYLHALRAYFAATDQGRAAAVSRSALFDETARRTFDQLLAALTLKPTSASQYWLKYEDGIADGGGLDADDAAQQFGALAKIHKKILPILVDQTPFLESSDEIPSPRVHELQAASANIGFGIALPNRPLFERVARYFELQMIQDIVRGNVPLDLQDDGDFQDALSRLLNPSPDTRVLQTPLGQVEPEPVAFQAPFEAQNAQADARMVLFGTVEGITGEVRRAELKFFPQVRESVSTTDDGNGHSPEGHTVFYNRNDFLFRPAVFGVERFVDPNRRYRFFLQSCQILDAGDSVEIDAIPSSVVTGAFLQPPSPVSVAVTSGGGVTIAGIDMCMRQSPSLSSVRCMLVEFEQWAKAYEISVAERGEARWVKPVQPRRPSALYRLLIALSAKGGSAVVTDVIVEINRRFDTMVRRNNTFREIGRNRELLGSDEEDDDKIQLTPRGQLFVRIYQEAGGLMGHTDS